MARQRALFLVKRFSAPHESRWLTDELVWELVSRGFFADVALLDVNRFERRDFDFPPDQVSVRHYRAVSGRRRRAGMMRRLPGLFASVARLHASTLIRAVRAPYDFTFVFSVGSFFGLLPVVLRRLRLTRRLVFVLWDFFPGHHVSIGVIPRWLGVLVRPLERAIVQTADVVCVMSEANRKAAIDYFGVEARKIVVVPPWGEGVARPDQIDSGQQHLHVVFGGQTGRGRDLSWLIDGVVQASAGTPVRLSIVGSVPAELKERIHGDPAARETVDFVAWMERSEYMDYLAQADAGVVVTDGRVGFPTFPSKIVDFFRAGLPVLACLESASDVSQLVSSGGLGLSCTVGSREELQRVLERGYALKQSGELRVMGKRARDYFEAEMDVRVAATRMLDALHD